MGVISSTAEVSLQLPPSYFRLVLRVTLSLKYLDPSCSLFLGFVMSTRAFLGVEEMAQG